MRIAADWLESHPAQSVASAINSSGFTALFVGGCVRNTLLARPVNDLDLATDARPEQVLAIASTAKIKAIPTGMDHGTITLIVDRVPIEVTTFRKDMETDGRHAIVAFSDDVAQDAARRDFTMNALYAQADGLVIDPLNGLPDLEARRVRFVGRAPDRVTEDYLRILRFFRFHAWYGDPDGGLDAEGLAACAAHVQGLTKISAERITSELLKLLTAADPSRSVAAMEHSGVLAQVLQGATARALPVFLHWQGRNVHPVARLAALGGDISVLRLSSAQATQVHTLRKAATSTQSAAELGYRLGATDGLAALHLRAALLETPVDAADIALGAEAVFPLKAKDLMPRLTGPALGKALKQLEGDWINARFSLSRDDLIRRSHEL